MNPLVQSLAAVALLTAGYWLVDATVRGDGFLKLIKRLGLKGRTPALVLWLLPCLAASPFWKWDPVVQGESLRILASVLAAILAWQGATRDIDPVAGGPGTAMRLLVAAVAAGVYLSPAFLFAAGFLLTTPFHLWQHHATLPMRLLQALMAHSLLLLFPTGLFTDLSVPVFFLLIIFISHYLITALAKTLLGPRWHSWVTENRMHHLAASAYSWGWARFLPWSAWLKFIHALKRIEKPLQAAAFALELLSPLALLHPKAAFLFCLGWAAFHLGVFAVSGLLFWDWILSDLAMAGAILLLPPEAADKAFGIWSVAASLAFMALFPLRHKLWKPMPLGWYDTPFTQRVHWRLRGTSGKEYGLYNDFMCPHERLYGKVHGCFLAPVPVITYHLGEVWKPDLRDAIHAAGPHPEKLDEVRRRYGIHPLCAERSARHLAYLRRFFLALNAGARKHALPAPLRWLKAPGDQVYYWGDLPAYRRQEKVVKVSLHYREEYFDGESLRRLREEKVAEVDLEPREDALEDPAPFEPTPKEIDDFLLAYAAGRLIDLPGFGGGYVKGDDGRRAGQAL